MYQDLPSTLNWGYMVPNSGYLGPNKVEEEGLRIYIYVYAYDVWFLTGPRRYAKDGHWDS